MLEFMTDSKNFYHSVAENQVKNDERFETIEQSHKRLEATTRELVSRAQGREIGALPSTVDKTFFCGDNCWLRGHEEI